MILIDTNVFSEVTKPRPDERVVDWLFARRNETLLSTIVVAELTVGIRTTSGRTHRAMLLGWLKRLIERHSGRVIDFDLGAAAKWGEFGSAVLIREERVGSREFDTLIAAQALQHGVPLATRNWRHFEGVGLEVIDPWVAR
jgi:predicted nucleic acid-binding protein